MSTDYTYANAVPTIKLGYRLQNGYTKGKEARRLPLNIIFDAE